MFDYLVFIGRFQPFHNGHLAVIETALQKSHKVIVLVGSTDQSRSPRNPFTFEERKSMILLGVSPENRHRVIVTPLFDIANDDAWVAQIQSRVHNVSKQHGDSPKIGLIGFNKDATSYYLKLFPNWKSVNAEGFSHEGRILSATWVRDFFLNSDTPVIPEGCLPWHTERFLESFIDSPEFNWLREWNQYDIDYKKSWEAAPYPVIFTCVDAVVIQSGHILLIRRKNHPGKGLLALPGGHVEVGETFRQAVVRELKEETRISDGKGEIPPAMLDSFINDSNILFVDNPHRSSRGRVVTMAYHFELPKRKTLFGVVGDDDAEKAQWYPIGSIDSCEMFEDHRSIIRQVIGI